MQIRIFSIKSKYLWLTIGSTLLLLSGCSSSGYKRNFHVIEKGVKKQAFEGKNIFITPLNKANCNIVYGSTLVRELNPDFKFIEKDYIAEINSELSKALKEILQGYQVINLPKENEEYNQLISETAIIANDIPVGKNALSHSFPYPDQDKLKQAGIEADIIIHLSKFDVVITDRWVNHEQSGGFGTVINPETDLYKKRDKGELTTQTNRIRQANFNSMVRYLIWDYTKNSALGYGQFEITGTFSEREPGNYLKTVKSKTVNTVSQKVKKILT